MRYTYMCIQCSPGPRSSRLIGRGGEGMASSVISRVFRRPRPPTRSRQRRSDVDMCACWHVRTVAGRPTWTTLVMVTSSGPPQTPATPRVIRPRLAHRRPIVSDVDAPDTFRVLACPSSRPATATATATGRNVLLACRDNGAPSYLSPISLRSPSSP
ncbi:hypothetical protein BD310DRAFT_927425 [Dichomitus squalens]|uniref:Uncharacterized protein n=1 Tax=Dichomitus squalens TaxID=114155 RepID=A0A4Q9PV02_9APHY|nr:hypothetical protein BD310DRAFT_927425 [Dichomitus squalens]